MTIQNLIKNSYMSSNSSFNLTLDVYSKIKNNKTKIYNWDLYLNNNIVLSLKKINSYLDIWKYHLNFIINPLVKTRILIVGGGDQLLSNYLLKYPVDITIVDPCAYLYLSHDFKKVLHTKEYLNYKDPNDLEKRKLVLLDFTLKEAYEDGCFEDGEFDLILVDNHTDTVFHRTGMYDYDIPKIYFNLLKNKGFLIINHRFTIKRINSKTLLEYDEYTLDIIKDNNQYYTNYLNNLNTYLCETDFSYKQHHKISVYSKTYTGSIQENEDDV